MELPEQQLFRDVNSTTWLTPITKSHIQLFFNRFNKKTDYGYYLYESRHLLDLKACTVGEYTFLKGICKASREDLQYKVAIKLYNHGSIDETTCECAVGSGLEAHCKHVAVVLFAAAQMWREGNMLIDVASTQEVQSFHEPNNIHTTSPLKADMLPSKRQMSNIIFEPYPLNKINRENYNVRIRNICIGATTSTMPLKQRYGPANPYGILNDHNYYKKQDA